MDMPHVTRILRVAVQPENIELELQLDRSLGYSVVAMPEVVFRAGRSYSAFQKSVWPSSFYKQAQVSNNHLLR